MRDHALMEEARREAIAWLDQPGVGVAGRVCVPDLGAIDSGWRVSGSRMRIIAGRLKGRRARRAAGARRAADVGPPARDAVQRARRTSIEGARVLDGFAGTGALGLEAWSRGAAAIAFVERDPRALRALDSERPRLRRRRRVCYHPRRFSDGRASIRRASIWCLLDPPYGVDGSCRRSCNRGAELMPRRRAAGPRAQPAPAVAGARRRASCGIVCWWRATAPCRSTRRAPDPPTEFTHGRFASNRGVSRVVRSADQRPPGFDRARDAPVRSRDRRPSCATPASSRSSPLEDRLAILREVFARPSARSRLTRFQGLLVDYLRARGASVVVRGIRSAADLDYERQMALTNRHLNPDLDTVLLLPSAEFGHVSSSLVREIAALGGSVRGLVPPAVEAWIARRAHRVEDRRRMTADTLRLADRMQHIGMSPTMKGTMEAERLRRQGVDVVDLGAGEPDFPTPRARGGGGAARRSTQQFTKYTANCRHRGTARGRRRAVPGRTTASRTGRRSDHHRRRQAGAASRRAGAVRAGRRGHHAHARAGRRSSSRSSWPTPRR